MRVSRAHELSGGYGTDHYHDQRRAAGYGDYAQEVSLESDDPRCPLCAYVSESYSQDAIETDADNNLGRGGE